MRRIRHKQGEIHRVKSVGPASQAPHGATLIRRDDELGTEQRCPSGAHRRVPRRAPPRRAARCPARAVARRERRIGLAAPLRLVPPRGRRDRRRHPVAGRHVASPRRSSAGRAATTGSASARRSTTSARCTARSARPSRPTPVIRALCEGWADAQAGALAFGTALDPESGLPTPPVPGDPPRGDLPRRRDPDAARPHGRATSATTSCSSTSPRADIDPFTRAARSAAVGAAMTTTYGEGHPMATLGGGVFAVLARTDEHTQHAARGAARRDRPPVRAARRPRGHAHARPRVGRAAAGHPRAGAADPRAGRAQLTRVCRSRPGTVTRTPCAGRAAGQRRVCPRDRDKPELAY